MKPQETLPLVELPPLTHAAGLARLRLLPGTLRRLGAPALLRYARHRLRGARALPADAPVPEPPFLNEEADPDQRFDWFGTLPESVRRLPALAVPTDADFDIRLVWEKARLKELGQRAFYTPAWAEATVRSFVAENPPFFGPHWACGQEAAIRLAHLVLAQELLGEGREGGLDPELILPGMRALIALHRDRILATLDYAMAQDNNHATSEAAGLWLAGVVLGDERSEQRGRRLLERAVARLFLPGGAFAQQSMRYHVAALEMSALGQNVARKLSRPGLAEPVLARLREGMGWLARIIDPHCGTAWRVGPDDSSALIETEPSMLGILVRGEMAFDGQPRLGGPLWLDAEGGFAGLRNRHLRAYLRLPVHKFRPGQADALHLDLWHGSVCLLGDAGTALYNFNADPSAPDLARTAAHNTISFDDDDQMPRLSRFLYGAWLRPAELAAEPGGMLGAYRDWKGRFHRREVRLAGHAVTVEDRFDGRFTHATARFRLPDGAWRIEGERLCGAPMTITVEGAARLRLVRLPFAPEYGRWTTTPALEAIADQPGRLVFTITVAQAAQSA